MSFPKIDLLDGFGTVSVAGVSAQLSSARLHRNTSVGTPFWMAPEVPPPIFFFLYICPVHLYIACSTNCKSFFFFFFWEMVWEMVLISFSQP